MQPIEALRGPEGLHQADPPEHVPVAAPQVFDPLEGRAVLESVLPELRIILRRPFLFGATLLYGLGAERLPGRIVRPRAIDPDRTRGVEGPSSLPGQRPGPLAHHL